MTRMAGYRYTVTPCCRRQYLEAAFASINFSATEYWTDGHREASLAPTDAGLRHCACGRYYTKQEADYLPGILKTDDGSAPRGQPVSDSDLTAALESGNYSEQAEIALRRRFWRADNESYRQAYRALRKTNAEGFPAYALGPTAQQNLMRLAQLLKGEPQANALELCEIYRNLAMPNEASAALTMHSAEATEVRMVELMRELLGRGVAGPVRFRL